MKRGIVQSDRLGARVDAEFVALVAAGVGVGARRVPSAPFSSPGRPAQQ